MIPDEAVEAAKKVAYERYGSKLDTAYLRTILEAAAPHIIEAWINDMSRLPKDLPGYGPEGRIK